ncbi:hypothetical protein [Halomarina oriensis]|uniref:Uncharacterized protein n=1 Tax=Halomarina oriensis TaxID=671145 RepID=A0A6B0GH08_9EURY|nr:hypothetical protein [Halomarina oriensis]MWG34162.1 hypothetical protein [Halomarina oriensis]
MAGASLSREHPSDQQCEHCTLWFSKTGIHNHEAHCPVSELPDGVTVVREDGLAVEDERDDRAPDTSEEVADTDDASPIPLAPDTPNEEGAVVLPDGGSVEDVPNFDDLQENADEDDGEQDEATCPHCGSGFGMTPEEAAEHLAGETGTCGDCGGEVQA